MNPQDVCGYTASCLECVQGGNYFVETVHHIICCVANLGTLDDAVISVAKSLSDCPSQPMSAASILWVTLVVLTVLALTIGTVIWMCTQKRERTINVRGGLEDIPLVSYTRESVDSNSFAEATYEEPPTDHVRPICPIVHYGLRTYVNVPII